MKRQLTSGRRRRASVWHKTAVAAGLWLGIAVAEFVHAQSPTLIIVNNDEDGDSIDRVFVTPADQDHWGPNRLAVRLMDRQPAWLYVGESVDIRLDGGGMRDRCMFKVLIIDTDDDLTEYEINLCEIGYVVYG